MSDRSRVLRQLVTIELIWRVDPDDDDLGFRDWETELRTWADDAGPVSAQAPMTGVVTVTDLEELTADA